ncbi:MAG: hypothetical protein Kapaf2KO_01820 [Candidatus Kapaibacteriales bacterium]
MFSGKVDRVFKEDGRMTRVLLSDLEYDSERFEPLKCRKAVAVIFTDFYINEGDIVHGNGRICFPSVPNLQNEFDELSYMRSLGADGTIISGKVSVVASGGVYTFSDMVKRTRSWLENNLKRNFSGQALAVSKAMLLGDKSFIESDTKAMYSRSGTSHLLAVSGLHTGIIAAVIFLAVGYISDRRVKFAVFAVAISAYVILSGIQPSALRAAIMASAFLYFSLIERNIGLKNALALAVVIGVLLDPSLVFSVGFQMSVLALSGISLFYVVLYEKLKRVFKVKFFAASIAVSLSSTVFLNPYIGDLFGTFSIVSPIVNFFAVPLYSFSLLCTVIGQLVSLISYDFGSIYFGVSGFVLDIGMITNEYYSELTYSSVTGDMAVVAGIVGSGIILFLAIDGIKRKVLWVALPTAMLAFLVLPEKKSGYYERKNIVLFEEFSSGKSSFLLVDKYYSTYPELDFGLKNYLSSRVGLGDTVLVSGMHGTKATDAIKHDLGIVPITIDIDKVRKYLEESGVDIRKVGSGFNEYTRKEVGK